MALVNNFRFTELDYTWNVRSDSDLKIISSELIERKLSCQIDDISQKNLDNNKPITVCDRKTTIDNSFKRNIQILSFINHEYKNKPIKIILLTYNGKQPYFNPIVGTKKWIEQQTDYSVDYYYFIFVAYRDSYNDFLYLNLYSKDQDEISYMKKLFGKEDIEYDKLFTELDKIDKNVDTPYKNKIIEKLREIITYLED